MLEDNPERALVAEAARTRTHATWTYEDLLAEGLRPRDWEIVAGELVRVHEVSQEGGGVWARLAARLVPFVTARGLGHVPVCGRFLLREQPRTERRPDLAFVRAERIRQRPIPDLFPGAPDIAIEVLSPSDPVGDAAAKARDYLAAGAEEVWLVNEGFQAITVFRRGVAPRSCSPGEVLESPTLLPGFALALEELFPPPA